MKKNLNILSKISSLHHIFFMQENHKTLQKYYFLNLILLKL